MLHHSVQPHLNVPVSGSMARASVMLVNDSEGLRSAIVEVLQPFYEVTAVLDHRAAMMVMKKSAQDLVLCDDFSVRELASYMRMSDVWSTTPIVLLTEQEADANELPPNQSPDEIISIPCPPARLLSRINSYMRLTRRWHEAESRLRECESFIESLTVSVADCLVRLDLDGRVTWMSAGGLAAMGLEDFDSIQGSAWVEWWKDFETYSHAVNAVAGAIESQTSQFQGYCPTVTGYPKWWDVTVTPVHDSVGMSTGILCVARDITGMKRTEQSLRASEGNWRDLMQSMPQLLWTANGDGIYDFVSPQFEAYTGKSPQELCGQGWLNCIHPVDKAPVLKMWTLCVQQGSIFDFECRIRGVSGETRWFKCRAVPVCDESGTPLRWYGSNTDIEDLKRAEAALRENEAHLQAIFEQAGAGIVQISPDGHYIMVNDAYCEITGRSRHELLQLSMMDTTFPEDRELAFAPFDALFHGGPPFIMEKRYLRPDESSVWARKSVVGLRDLEGMTLSALAIVQDITDNQMAESEILEREAQLRFVTDHAPILLAQVDRDFHYKFVNRPYANRYNREPEEIVGRPLVDIVGKEVFERARPYAERAFAGQQIEFELEMPYDQPDLGVRWGHIIYVPEYNHDGDVIGFVSLLTDITMRKQVEIELEKARDEALAASRAKDDFLARLSHELRTPLGPALLIASEAADNASFPAEARKDFEAIRKNVDLEARLIDDLLDLTRIVHGKLSLDIRPLDMHAVLQDALDTIQSEVTRKKQKISLRLNATKPKVMGDAVRLQQVFWNVLKNAVKFSPYHREITVESLDLDDGHKVAVRISDSGIGMSREEMEHVFDAFSQGHHSVERKGAQHYGGLGLGLAITRMLVEKHSGIIRASSEGRGKGSVFTIELPVASVVEASNVQTPSETEPTAPPEIAGTAKTAGSLRILLAEDDDATRNAMQLLLSRRGHRVTAVANVADALRVTHAEIFDLLISDIGLPDASGYELMIRLRDQCGIPGIALTGYGMEHDVAKSKAAGFSTHLTKPVRVKILENAINDTMAAFKR